MNSHVIATEGYEAPIVRTGYEYITSKRNSNLFAFRATQDGKVVSVNSKGIIVEYTNGEKVGVELGVIYGRAEGSYYPHHVITHKKVNDVFKKDDVLAYNTKFYEQDIYSPGSIILKTVKYAKVALMENNNTFEDSSAISKNFSKTLTAKTTKVKSVMVNFKQNIHNLVKVGDKIKANDKLMIVEDEISSGYNFDKKALEILQNLAQQTPTAEYSGTVENIEIYYNGDLEDMSASLREAALLSDNKLAYAKKSSNQPVIFGRVTDEYRVDGVPLMLDTLEIKIYITVDNPMGLGDKGIFANQMKSVVGEVMNYDVKTEAGEPVDAIFGFKSIYNRIVLSPILIGTSATLMNVIAKKAVQLYRSSKK